MGLGKGWMDGKVLFCCTYSTLMGQIEIAYLNLFPSAPQSFGSACPCHSTSEDGIYHTCKQQQPL